jgi:hypothetical protein
VPKGDAVAGISAGNSENIRFAVAFYAKSYRILLLRYFYRFKTVEIAVF